MRGSQLTFSPFQARAQPRVGNPMGFTQAHKHLVTIARSQSSFSSEVLSSLLLPPVPYHCTALLHLCSTHSCEQYHAEQTLSKATPGRSRSKYTGVYNFSSSCFHKAAACVLHENVTKVQAAQIENLRVALTIKFCTTKGCSSGSMLSLGWCRNVKRVGHDDSTGSMGDIGLPHGLPHSLFRCSP